jgi:Asp-tRNA(Asn)/Glu-tRNA(Gln) amidotransferase A subunit family amidase
MTYDPKTTRLLSFAEAAPKFRDGTDSPRAFLERCLEVIARRDNEVKAFVRMDAERARRAADESAARYKAGRPLSAVDGMPFGVKDMFDTADMDTEMGTPFHRGRRPMFDAAHVDALKRGGAVLVGKTVTSQFAVAGPGPTRNPFDPARSPGATSAGSAAAVGAAMIPVATGSHTRGSVIRPAGYCANFALKATFGALNRGGIMTATRSTDHLGIHAGALADLWATAWQIATVAGGDPGHPGLYGRPELPPARKPIRLIRIETRGWGLTDAASQAAFLALIETLRRDGIEIADRASDPAVADYENTLHEVSPNWGALATWESRWPMRLYRERDARLLHPAIAERVAAGEKMTLDEYRRALAFQAAIRRQHASFAGAADAFVTLSAPGPAPFGDDVGDAVYNEPSSLLGAPALNLPLLAVSGMPLGVQLLGFDHRDWELAGIGRWLAERVLG